ncbi:MAG: DNA polymerase I [Rhodospirillales bacterium]|nr:DNA polymerase I [Rhodospirillales bacterium]
MRSKADLAAEPAATSLPRHVLLIDGSGFIFRAFHKLPPLTRPDGTPVNAVLGFTNMLLKLLGETDADHLAVIFDAARLTFRNDLYPAYKAHRPDPPDELIPQFALIREAVRAFNVACIESDGWEADDLIATYARLAREAGAEVTIVSSDKDLMQLVRPGVAMFDPMNNRPIGADEVREKFGVGPEKVIEVQALAGDSVDNVPGVPGIGIKTAAQLIEQFGDVETLLARAGEIRQPKRRQMLIDHADAARISRQLVSLRDDVPEPVPLAALEKRAPDRDRLLAFLQEQAFRAVIARLQNRGDLAPSVLAAPGAAASAETSQATAGAPPGAEPAPIPAPAAAPRPDEVRYELVQDEAALALWVNEAQAAGYVAVDTETTSLDVMRAELVGVSLSIVPGRACYVPLGHRATDVLDPSPRQIPLAAALARLKPLLEDAAVLKIGQNIKYDMQVLGRLGIAVTPIDDTMLLSYVLEGGLHGHGMDELAELHLGHVTVKYAEVTGRGKTQVTFDCVPLDQALRYAAEDADVTLQLHRALKPRLQAERLVGVYETLERPLVPVLAEMERNGIIVDAARLRGLSGDFAAKLAVLEGEIHTLAGRRFNIGSPKQLGEVLFDELGLATGRKGKTGAYGTGADVLEALAAEGHDLPQKVLDWRQLAKLKSTYADALVSQINPTTGRVHTSFQQAVAGTGRLSSSDPNLQNIPVRTEEGRKIRRAFVPADGCVLMSADYSQIELRLLADVARIDALEVAFRDGQDIHAMTASQVFGVPIEGMDPLVRRKAKAINFGIIYGISPFGLARQLGIGRAEAAAYIDAYFERYPGIRDYMQQAKEQARQQGFVVTPFGRRCWVRGINEKNSAMRSFAERAAINAPIQGGAADIIKRAMIRVSPALAQRHLGARMLLQVHDELLFEVPVAEVDETTAVVSAVMQGVARLRVPLIVDVGTGANWDEAH